MKRDGREEAGRATSRVAMAKRYRLLGCFLGNLEIGYSGTSIGRTPSDFKLSSSRRIGNVFVGVRRKDRRYAEGGR